MSCLRYIRWFTSCVWTGANYMLQTKKHHFKGLSKYNYPPGWFFLPRYKPFFSRYICSAWFIVWNTKFSFQALWQCTISITLLYSTFMLVNFLVKIESTAFVPECLLSSHSNTYCLIVGFSIQSITLLLVHRK